jgi:DNA processing protein
LPRRAGNPPTTPQATSSADRAAVVALLRLSTPDGGRADHGQRTVADLLTRLGDAERALGSALEDSSGQTTLLPADPAPLIERARADVERWEASGIELVSVLDDGYPPNLHAVHDRPALLFVRGRMTPADARSVAIIGSRRASADGAERARTLAREIGDAGYVIVSGLATGIDAVAHRTALQTTGRTLAVIGTGVDRAYPPAHAELQRTIASAGAVVSCVWPDQSARRRSFPVRNGLMSGLTRGTVIVEASEYSGTRTQARRALGHGRPVFLHPALLACAWARELAERPNVHVAADAATIVAILRRQRPGERPLVDA